MPKKVPEWLNADIQEVYPTCQGNIKAIQRAIQEKRGVEIAYMTITDRMKRLGLERPSDKLKQEKREDTMTDETPVEVLPGQMPIEDTNTPLPVDRVSAIADIVPVTDLSEPLSPVEVQTLEHYEEIIAQGIKTFVQVGQALLTISDQRLYRQNYGTFEDYLRQRWDLSRPYAYQLMEASTVVENVSAIADIVPVNEAQARPLTKLPAEQQQEVWKVAVATAPAGKVTAKHVQATVKRVRERTSNGSAAKPIAKAPEPTRPPRMVVQDGLFTVLSMVRDGDAWTILHGLAQLMDAYAEQQPDADLTQRMEQGLSPLWHIIDDHEQASTLQTTEV